MTTDPTEPGRWLRLDARIPVATLRRLLETVDADLPGAVVCADTDGWLAFDWPSPMAAFVTFEQGQHPERFEQCPGQLTIAEDPEMVANDQTALLDIARVYRERAAQVREAEKGWQAGSIPTEWQTRCDLCATTVPVDPMTHCRQTHPDLTFNIEMDPTARTGHMTLSGSGSPHLQSVPDPPEQRRDLMADVVLDMDDVPATAGELGARSVAASQIPEGQHGAWAGDVWIPVHPGRRRLAIEWTPEQKAAVLAWGVEHSWKATARRYKVGLSTLVGWRREAGMDVLDIHIPARKGVKRTDADKGHRPDPKAAPRPREPRDKPASAVSPLPAPKTAKQPAGRLEDPYGCACGDRFRNQRMFGQHIATTPKVKGRTHKLVDRPDEPAQLLGQARAGVSSFNRPEAVHVVRPHTNTADFQL